MLNIILMGPPGAGKGTQAVKIEQEFSLPHISTGDMFRAEMASGSELGKTVKEIINRGDLVPDELTCEIVKARLSQPDCANGYMLDGFPRTLPQAEALEKMGKEINRPVTMVINVSCPDEELKRRITGRRVCPKCGASYHIIDMRPKKEGVCDLCGSELIQRKDDNLASFDTRLSNYYKSTAPLIAFYKEKGLLFDFDGTIGSENVKNEIFALLRGK